MELQPIFERIEQNPAPLADYGVSAEINTVVEQRKSAGDAITIEMQAEAMAFDFCEDYEHDQTGWGTYYGPQTVVQREGRNVEWPSIQAVKPATLQYWQQRSEEAKHPVLKARYADLVWDLSPKVTSKRADIACVHTAIDSYAQAIAGGKYKDRNEAVTYADRALKLAVALHDETRIEAVRDAILTLDAAEAPDDEGGGIAFDLLVGNKKVLSSEQTLAKIISGQEHILSRSVQSAENEGGFPFSVDRTAERLAAYYRSGQKYDDVKRVGGLWARAKIAMANRAAPILGAEWLRDVFAKLKDFGCHHAAEAVSVVLRDLGKKLMGQMVEYTETIEIPKKEMDDSIDAILQGELADVLRRVVQTFVPDPDRIEKQVKELAKTTPLTSFLSISQVDADGRQVAQIGSIKDDLDGRVIRQMGQNLQFEAFFLRQLIKELVVRHSITSDNLIEEVSKSPLFEENRKATWRRGLEAYLAGDHLVAAHLLIPQIEHALRLLAVGAGGSAYKLNRRIGGIQLKTFGDLLIDRGVVRVLGGRTTAYLKVVFSDPRGLNLRNDLLHGIMDPQRLDWLATDRILHVILLLGSVRAHPKEPHQGA